MVLVLGRCVGSAQFDFRCTSILAWDRAVLLMGGISIRVVFV